MNTVHVMIVEDNALQRDLLVATLEQQGGIQVIYAAKNGEEALQTVERMKPDVVIFDMVMPRLDGFGLLERVRFMPPGERPVMIALTSLGREDFIIRASDLGADDYLVKPVDPQLLADRIRQHAARRAGETPVLASASDMPEPPHAPDPQPAPEPDEQLARYVSILLMELGVPAHLSGCQYMQQGILLALQQPSIINHVTTQLYPAIAAACDTTPSRVERSIRNAIAITWDRGGGAALNKLLGRPASTPAPKPANSELLAQLAARVRVKRSK